MEDQQLNSYDRLHFHKSNFMFSIHFIRHYFFLKNKIVTHFKNVISILQVIFTHQIKNNQWSVMCRNCSSYMDLDIRFHYTGSVNTFLHVRFIFRCGLYVAEFRKIAKNRHCGLYKGATYNPENTVVIVISRQV